MAGEQYKIYPHNPPHLFRPGAIYMVTGGTLNHQHFLNTDDRKAQFCTTLFERAQMLQWELEAWAVMSNHYHFIAHSGENPSTLKTLVQAVHSISAKYVNRIDGTAGRRVWYNYWDSCITYEGAYLARLLDVHMNPVKHQITLAAEDYPFCSYGWFVRGAMPGFCERVLSQPIGRLAVQDDF